ncbi:MAG: peptidoglycan-binding protein [Clostridia bacterium]|nr:peptidoglycan-binding protein [Clostridia bacterium]
MRMENEAHLFRRFLCRALALLIALTLIGGAVPSLSGGLDGWLPGAQAEAAEWKTLKKGSSGAEVKKAQQALRELGYYQGKLDGNFSKAFEEAVIAFQADFGLEQTGKLDEETYLLITEGLPDAPDEEEPEPTREAPSEEKTEEAPFVTEDGSYSDKDHVAAYLRAFGHLPSNYITKSEAQDLGWENRLGNLWDVAPGKSIGGDRFGNYEGLLPTAKGRKYYECDIDFDGGYRNGKRIIFSSDGLIFYTEDHYNTFEEITE